MSSVVENYNVLRVVGSVFINHKINLFLNKDTSISVNVRFYISYLPYIICESKYDNYPYKLYQQTPLHNLIIFFSFNMD